MNLGDLIAEKISALTAARLKLLEFPAHQHQARARAAAAKAQVKTWTQDLAQVSGELMAEIQNTVVEGTPKPKFTSDAARNAELKRRLTEDNEAKILQKRITEDESAVRNADLDVSKLEDEEKGWQYHLNALMKEADLLLGQVALKAAEVKILELSSIERLNDTPRR